MDTKVWSDAWDSAIAGDSYRYFYDEGKETMNVDNTSIFFADEKELDIQNQKYILIVERVDVEDVIRIAEENKVDISEITFDTPDYDLGDRKEKPSQTKVTSILRFWKEKGTVQFCRAVKNVIYQPQNTNNMTLYPIASLVLYPKKWSCRGKGVVKPLINNQVELNKLMANRSLTINNTAFPKPVFLKGGVLNPSDLHKVGSAIEINAPDVRDIDSVIKYLQPASTSPDASRMAEEMLMKTRELASAGKALTGDINPEQASGTAIMAVRDQAMLPSNRQIQIFQQYIEDIALVMMDMWKAFEVNGIKFVNSNGEVDRIEKDFRKLKLSVRIDVSSESPLSKMARENNLLNLLQWGKITFEEWVEYCVEKKSNFDKATLMKILIQREERGTIVDNGQEIPIGGAQGMPQEEDIAQGMPELSSGAQFIPEMEGVDGLALSEV